MKATLSMYDIAETAAHTDRLWCVIAGHLRDAGLQDVPEALDRGVGSETLLATDLLLAQTCGYPLTHALAGRLRYVATPCYHAPGCAGAFYRSAFVVRAEHPARTLADCLGGVFAVNSFDSQSGWNAPRLAIARIAGNHAGGFLASVVETGAHAHSLAAVAAGNADLCAVDGVTLALLRRHRPSAFAGLRLLGWTEPAPGLPLVTRADATDAEIRRLRAALILSLRAPDLASTRAELLLAGIEVLPVAVYQRILDMEQEAERLGYSREER